MLSRRWFWPRLAAALCAVLALAGQPRQSAAQATTPVFPNETLLLPSQSIKGVTFDTGDNQVVWIDQQNNLAAIDIMAHQKRPLGAVSPYSHDLIVRGDMVVWAEAEGPEQLGQPGQLLKDRLRGLSLSDGSSFAVNEGFEDVGTLVMSASRLVWTRQVGQSTQILGSRLPPQGAPALLAEVGGATVRELTLTGPELSWIEQRPSSTPGRTFASQIRALNIDAGGAPATLLTVDDEIRRFTRSPGTLVWSVPMKTDPQPRAQLFMLDQRGRPLLLDDNVLTFKQLGLEVIGLTARAVTSYDLLSGKRSLIASVPPQAAQTLGGRLVPAAGRGAPALDDENICWLSWERPWGLDCYSRSSGALVEAQPPGPGFSLQISGKSLVLGTRGAGPNDPAAVYTLPLADFYKRAKPVIPPAPSAPAGDPAAFDRLWERQDLLVQQGKAARSWTWGPQPLGPAQREPYAEGPGRSRLVRYYDKSRMEINDPSADPNSPWYVTNGLLPVELITGRVQTGNQSYEQRAPAAVAAVGDPGQFPTYADLAPLYSSPGALDPAEQGRPATRLLNPDGSLGSFGDYASDPATVLVVSSNGYSLPRAFSDFMGQRGPIWQGGRAATGPVYDPLFVFGLPVTAPYWVNVRVGGVVQPVLFQVFERRVLTYSPANPPGFRVEMGNVGQHYYQWRYK